MPIVQINTESMLHKPAPYVDLLREAGFEVRYPRNPQLGRGGCDEQTVIEELQDVSATIATAERYTQHVIASLPQLRVIARSGVGYDRVDVEAATEHRVAVTITPTGNHEAVAELALALLFAVAKRIRPGDIAVHQGEWPRTILTPIRTKTLGILGLGRIGRSIAVRAIALGMNVIAHEMYPDQNFVAQHEIELVDFDSLLSRSDFITIHAPLTEETRGLLNKNAFGKMKEGAALINTARGGIVVESDLHEALTSGHLSAAGLDVFQQEPPSLDNPLLALDCVVTTPHIAGSDEISLEKVGIEAAECIVKLHRGQWPEGAVVNNELKAGWKWA